jgi:hypothetical protein
MGTREPATVLFDKVTDRTMSALFCAIRRGSQAQAVIAMNRHAAPKTGASENGQRCGWNASPTYTGAQFGRCHR